MVVIFGGFACVSKIFIICGAVQILLSTQDKIDSKRWKMKLSVRLAASLSYRLAFSRFGLAAQGGAQTGL